MKCSKCGRENNDSSSFCGSCGTRLHLKCSSCGSDIDPTAKFCCECGKKIIESDFSDPSIVKVSEKSKTPVDESTKKTIVFSSESESGFEDEDAKKTIIRGVESKPETTSSNAAKPEDEIRKRKAPTPFRFKGGGKASTLEELVYLCWTKWDIAKGHFGSGDFDSWLESLDMKDLKKECEKERKKYRNDLSTGLEEFLRNTGVSVGKSIVKDLSPRELARRVGIKADIIFVIDTTGSMSSMIEGLKNTAIAFAEEIVSAGIDYRLGLIGFGDVLIGENPTIYPLTDDAELFQDQVRNIPRTNGGDLPESSLEALKDAMKFGFRPKAQKVVILITDAPPHDPDFEGWTGERVLEQMLAKEIFCFVIGPDLTLYRRFVDETQAVFFPISSTTDYLSILKKLPRAVGLTIVSRLA